MVVGVRVEEIWFTDQIRSGIATTITKKELQVFSVDLNPHIMKSIVQNILETIIKNLQVQDGVWSSFIAEVQRKSKIMT